jgi:hypothetical protein
MRVALFHDDDPRVPRLRGELSALGHHVMVVGPGAAHGILAEIFEDERPDVIHSLGRGFHGLMAAAYWRVRLGPLGTKRVHDVAGVPAVDAVVDGSLPGRFLVAAYSQVLGLS